MSNQERKEILRCIIDHIVVTATKQRIDAKIFWKSGVPTVYINLATCRPRRIDSRASCAKTDRLRDKRTSRRHQWFHGEFLLDPLLLF